MKDKCRKKHLNELFTKQVRKLGGEPPWGAALSSIDSLGGETPPRGEICSLSNAIWGTTEDEKEEGVF